MLKSRMKVWLHVFAALVCMAGSIACVVAAWPRTEIVKRFRADEAVKDLGTLKQKEEKDVVFRLINASDKPVEIVRVSTSCTCTRAEPAARNLQPGESTELKAHLRVGNLRGKIAASVSVLYQSEGASALARLPLLITATVEPHYTVTPEEVVIQRSGDAKGEAKSSAVITIVAREGTELRVLEAHSTHPAVRVEKISPDTVAGTTTIHLVFDSTRCIAPTVQAVVTVHTDSKMEPIHHVPVRVVSDGVR